MTRPIEPEIRRATESDLETIEAIMNANDTPPPGAAPVPVGAQLPYLRHLLDRGTVLVAEIEG
jgi:hypothetical protein